MTETGTGLSPGSAVGAPARGLHPASLDVGLRDAPPAAPGSPSPPRVSRRPSRRPGSGVLTRRVLRRSGPPCGSTRARSGASRKRCSMCAASAFQVPLCFSVSCSGPGSCPWTQAWRPRHGHRRCWMWGTRCPCLVCASRRQARARGLWGRSSGSPRSADPTGRGRGTRGDGRGARGPGAGGVGSSQTPKQQVGWGAGPLGGAAAVAGTVRLGSSAHAHPRTSRPLTLGPQRAGPGRR